MGLANELSEMAAVTERARAQGQRRGMDAFVKRLAGCVENTSVCGFRVFFASVLTFRKGWIEVGKEPE
jgi:hypothetical protein